MTRTKVFDADTAMAELNAPPSKPCCREGRPYLPFHELHPPEFEVLSFRLLLQEHPADRLYYYGKTGDRGRDIIHLRTGRTRLVQCKRYTAAVGIDSIRGELAKLCVNVFSGRLPEPCDEVMFYIAPDVSSDAADLIRQQQIWRKEAPRALRDHLKREPPADLLAFAETWWPEPDYVAAIALTERLDRFPLLRDEFFGIKMVIDANLADVQKVVRDALQPIREMLTPLLPAAASAAPAEAPPSTEITKQRVAEAFGTASTALLSWPTTVGENRWLQRDEVRQLLDRIANNDSSVTLLLGLPGSGKSALLAKLGQTLLPDGHSVLAIKADMLPTSIESLGTLTEFLHLPAPIVECIRVLSASRKVVVLIDQLDAVAELVDLQAGRLNALLTLIKQLSDRHNLHVVCSCRTFEHSHDIRLTSIDATAMPLTLPAWEHVTPVLQSYGISAIHWPESFREFLRTPQHLKVFLQRLQGAAEDQIFTTYQQLLDDLWDRRVLNPGGPAGRSRLLMDMAVQMAERETLWLPAVRFEDRGKEIAALEAEDILTRSTNGMSLGFRHQTLFEHARARAFARDVGSLTTYVKARQDGLFIRPVLWSSLNYLRGADAGGYQHEMEQLWNDAIRKHIRYLLIDFLGQVSAPAPSPQELRWVLECLQNQDLRVKTLAAVRGNMEWFRLLAAQHFPAIMRLPDSEAWPILGVLAAAWDGCRTEVLALVKAEWFPDQRRDALTWQVLQHLTVWDVEAVELLCRVLDRSDFGASAVMFMVQRVAEGAPALAVALVRAKLMRELAKCEAEPDPQPPTPAPDAPHTEWLVYRLTHRSNARFADILDRSQEWYDLFGLAEQTPVAFLEALWPWFIRVLDHLREDRESVVDAYPRDMSVTAQLPDPHSEIRGHHQYEIMGAVDAAVRALADESPDAFLAFVEREQDRNSMTVQRLLCRGMRVIADTRPAAVLRFLVGDPRRMALGGFDDEHGDTIALLSALAPHLSSPEALELEKVVLSWQHYRPSRSQRHPQDRFEMAKWEREHRMRLLGAIPLTCLSPETQSLVRSEREALPRHAQSGIHRVMGGRIDSPMSAIQMGRAKDSDIVNLFATLIERGKRPGQDFRGGVHEVGYQFAEFAKADPIRAGGIMRALQPGRDDFAVGYALEAVAGTDYATDAFFALILDLNARGYRSEDFRTFVGSALWKRLRDGVGLPDSICALLERLLAEPWTLPAEPEPDDSDRDNDRTHSVLWQYGGMYTLPHGTYPVLYALTYGYLMRTPPATDAWLTVLEAHIERPDAIATWRVLTRELPHLARCDRARTLPFVHRLFERFPQARDSVFGAAMVTHLWSFLPREVTWQCLRAIRDSAWKNGSQVYGELLGLRHLLVPEDAEAYQEVASLLWPASDSNDTRMRIATGLAYAAAHFWNDAACRQRATAILTGLAPLADASVARAIMHTFVRSEPLVADPSTEQLLRAMLAQPRVLGVSEHSLFVERLQDVLPAYPDLVYAICKEMVGLRASDLTTPQRGFAASTSHLTNIALTFQRLGGKYRLQGLTLFERLLDIGVLDAQVALNELDKRPLPYTLPRPLKRTGRQ